MTLSSFAGRGSENFDDTGLSMLLAQAEGPVGPGRNLDMGGGGRDRSEETFDVHECLCLFDRLGAGHIRSEPEHPMVSLRRPKAS